MTAICKKCVHFHNREPGSVREDVWYNHVCLAAPLPTAVDPYDGKVKAYGTNHLGGRYFTDVGFKHCRDVNPDGRCRFFQL